MHFEIFKRLIEIVIKRFHNSEKFYRFFNKRSCVAYFVVGHKVFQIPGLIFQIFRLRMVFIITGGNILQCAAFYNKIFLKFRIVYNSVPFFGVSYSISER